MKKLILTLILLLTLSFVKAQDTLDVGHFDRLEIKYLGAKEKKSVRVDMQVSIIRTDSTRVHILNKESNKELVYTLLYMYEHVPQEEFNYFAYVTDDPEILVCSVYSKLKEFLLFGMVDNEKTLLFSKDKESKL